MISNNARKRKHLVKFTRHWKFTVKVKVTNDQLRNAFKSPEDVNELVNYIMHDFNDQMSNALFTWTGEEDFLDG